MYETVGEWLGRGGANREDVLDHWCRLIGRAPVSRSKLEGCVYQMVHRLASVMSVDRPSKHLVYHLFPGDADGAGYVDGLSHITATFELGAEASVTLLETPITPTAHADRTRAQLAVGVPSERPALVRSALLEGPLFDFGPTRRTLIV